MQEERVRWPTQEPIRNSVSRSRTLRMLGCVRAGLHCSLFLRSQQNIVLNTQAKVRMCETTRMKSSLGNTKKRIYHASRNLNIDALSRYPKHINPHAMFSLPHDHRCVFGVLEEYNSQKEHLTAQGLDIDTKRAIQRKRHAVHIHMRCVSF